MRVLTIENPRQAQRPGLPGPRRARGGLPGRGAGRGALPAAARRRRRGLLLRLRPRRDGPGQRPRRAARRGGGAGRRGARGGDLPDRRLPERPGLRRRLRAGRHLRPPGGARGDLARHAAGPPRGGLPGGRPAPLPAPGGRGPHPRPLLLRAAHRRPRRRRPGGWSTGWCRPRGREGAALALAEEIAAQRPAGGAGDEADRAAAGGAPTSAASPRRSASEIAGLRRRAFESEDILEGRRAFAERRPPRFQGR